MQIIGFYQAGESVIGLDSGDLFETLGGNHKTEFESGKLAIACKIDLGRVTTDRETYLFASYCKFFNCLSPWRGSMVTNAQVIDGRRYAPKAHPGDGFLESIDSDLSFRQAIQARKKLHTGDHLPHPDLTLRKSKSFIYTYGKAKPLSIDGKFKGLHRSFQIEIIAHAIELIVGFSN